MEMPTSKRTGIHRVENNYERECYQQMQETPTEASRNAWKGSMLVLQAQDDRLTFRLAGTFKHNMERAHSAADRLRAMIRDTFEDG